IMNARLPNIRNVNAKVASFTLLRLLSVNSIPILASFYGVRHRLKVTRC
ncbi:unnamed protein product, partial [marine sediment metagenome]